MLYPLSYEGGGLTETVRETPVGFTLPGESNALVSWHVQMSGGDARVDTFPNTRAVAD